MPGERAAALVIRHVTADMLALAARTTDIDEQITQLLDEHLLTEYIISMPGMGPVLTAELLVHTNGMTEIAAYPLVVARIVSLYCPMVIDVGMRTLGAHRGRVAKPDRDRRRHD
jgi:hypothetical protein